MSFFGKLKFWKKEEPDLNLNLDLGLGKGRDLNLGLEPVGDFPSVQPMGMNDFGLGQPQSVQMQFQPQMQPQYQPQPTMPPPVFQPYPPPNPMPQNVEIVAAKLDTIKVMLDNINQRLANLERAIYENQRRW